jgi:hypothetical protein
MNTLAKTLAEDETKRPKKRERPKGLKNKKQDKVNDNNQREEAREEL